jgi:endo-1,4-beta-xylanase
MGYESVLNEIPRSTLNEADGGFEHMKDFSTAIRKNRFHDFAIDCRVPGAQAVIRQLSHKFLFGSNVFGLAMLEGDRLSAYRERVLDIWNAGTLPFYWGRYEQEEGNPDPTGFILRAAKRGKAMGLTLKGHPLCWHTACADWLMKYDDETILAKQLERITRDVSRYAGLIDTWDVVNEAVIMPVFSKYDNGITRIAKRYGAVELVLKCFKAAREANPQARLLINDFNLSENYAKLIEELLERGCPIDVIGLQTHMHEGYRGLDAVDEYLARFARFKLPLHFTEVTMLSGNIAHKVDDLNDLHIKDWPSTPEGEARQLEEAAEFYSQVYSHPLTESLVWWDMVDGGWLGAPAGLLRADLTSKPAYDGLKRLIKGEWWFGEKAFPLQKGKPIRLLAPEGSYEALIDGKPYPFILDKKAKKLVIG